MKSASFRVAPFASIVPPLWSIRQQLENFADVLRPFQIPDKVEEGSALSGRQYRFREFEELRFDLAAGHGLLWMAFRKNHMGDVALAGARGRRDAAVPDVRILPRKVGIL